MKRLPRTWSSEMHKVRCHICGVVLKTVPSREYDTALYRCGGWSSDHKACLRKMSERIEALERKLDGNEFEVTDETN